jgi:hypothetical protein
VWPPLWDLGEELDDDGEDSRGRVALLIVEGHFDEPVSALEVWKEMTARNWTGTKAKNPMSWFYREFEWFTEKGFLRKVFTGKKKADRWQAVPGVLERIMVRDV